MKQTELKVALQNIQFVRHVYSLAFTYSQNSLSITICNTLKLLFGKIKSYEEILLNDINRQVDDEYVDLVMMFKAIDNGLCNLHINMLQDAIGMDEELQKKYEKGLKRLKNFSRLLTNHDKMRIYAYAYNKSYSYEALKEAFKNDRDKERLKQWFLNSIEYTDTVKRKQSKRYTVSRDLDRDTYYITSEGKLAKIKKNIFNKYRKKCFLTTDRKAECPIAEGIIIKPMKLINKVMPKINENFKLVIASLFEGIKPCKMVIDRDFEKAYEPTYESHQDTDGDKASNYSCMSNEGYRAENFYGAIDGCYVVRWELDDGTQVGRCIMYEYKGKRHFIRIYGKYEYHRTMINMLEAQMKEGDLFGRNKSIEDIKLKTSMTEDTECMYLDGNHYGLRREYKDYAYTYYVSTNYQTDAKRTDGQTMEELFEDVHYCDHCGEAVDDDYAIWIGDCVFCCSECAERAGYRYCNNCHEWFDGDNAITTNDGNTYCCDHCAQEDGYEYDTFYNEWVSGEELGNTADELYYTSRSGAAEHYDVSYEKIFWDESNYCWDVKEEKETEEKETTEEQ